MHNAVALTIRVILYIHHNSYELGQGTKVHEHSLCLSLSPTKYLETKLAHEQSWKWIKSMANAHFLL
jgi:hypothetical protein